MTAPRRADARENRERILAAARAQVAEAGVAGDLHLNAVAQRAGVGQGTLYRHFPTREALLAEVYRLDVEELVAAAGDLLATHDAVDALAAWFERVAGYAEVKRGVFAAVEEAVWRDLSAHSLGPIGDAVALLLDAGRREGTIRDDVDSRDVVVLIGFLSRLDPTEYDLRARSLLGVVLDGLRTRP